MKPTNDTRQPAWLLPAATAVLVAVCVWLMVPQPMVWLANAWVDDNPIVFTNFLRDPQFWRGDIIAGYGGAYAWGSIINWGTWLIDRSGIASAVTVSIGLTYLQNLLFYGAVYTLARAATAGMAAALITVLFALAARPTSWNLALYLPGADTPYAGFLVLAPVLFAAAAAVREQHLRAAAWLAGAALVHPVVALYGCAINGLYRVRARELRGALLYLLPAVIAAALTWLARGHAPQSAPRADMLAILANNMHMNPASHPERLRECVLAFTGFVLLVLISSRLRPFDSTAYRRLVMATTFVTIAGVFLHLAGWLLQLPVMIQANAHRTTILFVLIWLPHTVTFLLESVRRPQSIQAAAASVLLCGPAVTTWGFFWGPLAALAARLRHATQRLATPILLIWIGLLAGGLVFGVAGSTTSARPLLAVLLPGVYLSAAGAVLLLGLSGLTAAIPRNHVVAACLATAALFQHATFRAGDPRGATATSVYDAQQWAHRHTPRDAMFLVEPEIGWRTFAERRVVYVNASPAAAYSGDARAAARADSIAQFIAARTMSDVDWRELGRRTGTQYVVRRRTSPPLSAPVYANRDFVVYRLN